MAAHMGISDFFVQKAIHAGGKNTFYETLLRPGFGQFLSPILQPRERRKEASANSMLSMKDMVDEGLSRNRVKGNVLKFKLSHPAVEKRGNAFRNCIEVLACCKIFTSRHGNLCFEDPASKAPVAISDLTVFDPSVYSPKRLRDALKIRAPQEYEDDFSESVEAFKQRLPHFLKSNFGKEINIYANSPSTGKAPKKGICSCEVCMKRTKNAPHRTVDENIITNHHILPTRYGGSNDPHFITNICLPCHNHGNGIETIIASFEDNVRKMRLGQIIGLFHRHRAEHAEDLSKGLAANPYPKVYAIDYLSLYSNAVMLAMICTYFQEDTLITVNSMSRDRLIYSIAPMVLDFWQ